MASVFRKTATKPLPKNAEIFTRKGERFARWKYGRGKNRTADHQAAPLENHIAGYIDHQTAKGVHPARIDSTRSRLRRVAGDCGFARLADLSGSVCERWLLDRQREDMSAGARNGYREAWIGFANWCVKTSRLLSNPLSNVLKADDLN